MPVDKKPYKKPVDAGSAPKAGTAKRPPSRGNSATKSEVKSAEKPKLDARGAALIVLREFRQGRDLRTSLNAATDRVADARDRALAAQIVLGVVRNTALLDYYVASASNVPLRKIEPQALDILRAAVYQIAFLDKVPNSAAVNEAVNEARRKLPRASGFINAVLRKLGGAIPNVTARTKEDRLAIMHSHPVWLVREISARLGLREAAELLAANNAEPPVYLRANTLKTTVPQLFAELQEAKLDVTESALSGTLELRAGGEIARLSAFRRGDFFVQDPSSTRAAAALGVKPGDIVIDACAAPGGKSFAMAMMMENRGQIIAFDNEKKLDRIRAGARRLGITIIDARAGDSAVNINDLHGIADCVLVDAPCSGFGVIRKKPEIRFKTEADIVGLPPFQLQILRNCSAYVKPGGRLVYSTCTVLKAENEDVVAAFLAENPNFALEAQTTLWTHREGGDSFFYAVLVKSND